MKILVIAPHPDDETLGCGGALSRFRREQPDAGIHWMIVTDMKPKWGYSAECIAARELEIDSVAQRLHPVRMHRLGFQPEHPHAENYRSHRRGYQRSQAGDLVCALAI